MKTMWIALLCQKTYHPRMDEASVHISLREGTENQARTVTCDRPLDPLSREILQLKEKLNAVILAHNYQIPAIQDLADYVGDSLGLARAAAETSAEVIVFCGVHFMAETAKILNPEKQVLLPDRDAGCSLEQSCPAEELKAYQEAHPGVYTIAYINCSAAVKALSDVICTSGNAVRIVESAPADRPLLFVPDENLGAWVMEQTKRPMELWKGNCYAHIEFTADSILAIRAKHPEAPLVAHPECTQAVRLLADEICSTEKMVSFCRSHSANSFIIATEMGMLHRLEKECPGKKFIPAPTDHCACNECRYMKMNTLQKLHACMQGRHPEVSMADELIQRARLPIERMLEWSA